MSTGVGILGTERRSEGVHLRECKTVGLDVELPRNREKSLAAEEILSEIDGSALVARQIGEIERGDAKHCARPFRIGGCDNRRVDPAKAALVEKAVNGLRKRVPHPRRRRDHVRARPQMRDFA